MVAVLGHLECRCSTIKPSLADWQRLQLIVGAKWNFPARPRFDDKEEMLRLLGRELAQQLCALLVGTMGLV